MRKVLFILLAALAAIPCYGQQPVSQVTAQQINTPPFNPAPAVNNFSAAPTALGNATCYYWIVTQTPGATSTPLSLPLFICPTTGGGTAQNPVNLSWNLVPGATYDVLETTTSTMPVGTNTVAVATGITVGNLVDNGQARSSYVLLPGGLPWQEFNVNIAGVPTLEWCYNGNCLLQITPNGVNLPPPSGGGGGGPGGGTAGGSCTALLVSPGMVCAGPVPTATGQNPTFQNAFANNGGSSLAPPATITGTPLTSSSTIAFIGTAVQSGGLTNAPDGTWTLFDNATVQNDFSIYRKNISSASTLNLTSSFTQSGNSSWMEFLFFLGGTYTSTPHTATSSSFGGCSATDQCAQLTLGPVTANNTLLLFGENNSNSILALQNATVSDSLGDTWSKIASTSIPLGTPGSGGSTSVVFVDQFASAGSHVVTIDSRQNTTLIGGCCKAYEIAGATSYFSGASGPASFRYLTTQDLAIGGVIAQGVASTKIVTLSSNVTVTNADTTVQTLTLQAPQNGCPCRALISYSGWANFAGVTNEPDFDFWVSDGTVKMLPFTNGQSNASTGATATVSATGLSTVQYTNGQNITFTLHGIVSSANTGTQTFSYQAAQPTGGSGANSFFQVSFLPSF